MKYLKLFENQNIEDTCEYYNIKNWTLNPNGTIDVDGHVTLWDIGLDKIPLKFRRVNDWFDCGGNKLTDLVGCPTYIGSTFWCEYNEELWSFEGFPRYAKEVLLEGTPIEPVFELFSTIYEADGGEFFSTSWSLMDFFEHCDPVYPGGVIKKRRMNNFLHSIEKELKPEDIKILKDRGWKIED